MAARLTYFSPLNQIAMRPEANDRPAKYHRGHLDDSWQRDLILSHQHEDAVYLQKIERTDPFRFVHDTTDNDSATLTVIDCDGTTVKTITVDATADVPGNLAVDSSQYHSYLYREADLSDLDEGQYYFLLTIDYDGTHILAYISHPVWLRDTHEDTLLLEYSHSENTQGTYFEQLPVRFRFRVEGHIGRLIPKNTSTVYEDQAYNLMQLDSNSYREWPLNIGENGEGICDWVLDKLNHIFDCDTIYLDGKQYRRAISANWEIQSDESSPLYAASINIREADNTEGFTYGSTPTHLWNSLAYPYAIPGVWIGTSPSTLIQIGDTVVIDDASGLSDDIDAINAALPDKELLGEVTESSGTVEYEPGEGERFPYATVLKYDTFFGYTVSHGGGLTTAQRTRGITIRGGNLVIDWGEGEPIAANAGLTPVTYEHEYVTPGTYTVRIFGNTLDYLYINGTGTSIGGAIVSDFAGTLPPLRELHILNCQFPSNTFDYALLDPCQLTLEKHVMTGCALTAANNMNNYNFPQLTEVDVSTNAFSASTQDAYMYDILFNTQNNNLFGGTFSIVAQTTGVTITWVGGMRKSDLENIYNWTVNI